MNLQLYIRIFDWNLCCLDPCGSCGENAVCRFNDKEEPVCICPLDGDDSDPNLRCSKSNQIFIFLILIN